MTSRCSIVIPLFNRADLTLMCLRALIANTDYDSYELVLVDNGSTDETPQLCSAVEGDVTVVRNEENLGFAVACNQGAEAAGAEVVFFLNNDTEVRAGWLPPLLAAMEEPGTAVVGSRLLYPGGRVQHAGVAILETRNPLPGEAAFSAIPFPYRVPADSLLALRRRDVSVVTGAALMVSRDWFDRVGGFDDAYWCGYEDVDLCLKVGEQGGRIVYEPDSVITHHESASGAERFRAVSENERLLADRWEGRVQPDIVKLSDDTVEFPIEGRLAVHVGAVSRAERRARMDGGWSTVSGAPLGQ